MRRVLGRPRVPRTVTHSQRATEERILEKSTQPQTGLPADQSHISEQMVGWNAAFVIHFSWISLKTPPYRGHVSPPNRPACCGTTFLSGISLHNSPADSELCSFDARVQLKKNHEERSHSALKPWAKSKSEQRVDTSFPTLTKSLTTLLLLSVANVSGWRAVQPGSIYAKPSRWDLCLCLVPFQFLCDGGSCWQSRGSQASWWKAALSSTTTKSNGAWISPLFMTPATHFKLVTQLLDFLCHSDNTSSFPGTLSPSHLTFCLPRPVYFLENIFTSPSSVSLLTEITVLSCYYLTSVICCSYGCRQLSLYTPSIFPDAESWVTSPAAAAPATSIALHKCRKYTKKWNKNNLGIDTRSFLHLFGDDRWHTHTQL